MGLRFPDIDLKEALCDAVHLFDLEAIGYSRWIAREVKGGLRGLTVCLRAALTESSKAELREKGETAVVIICEVVVGGWEGAVGPGRRDSVTTGISRT